MGSEQQYIDLFKQAGQVLCENSADVLNEVRQAAFEDFCRLGFPSKKVERYKYIDVAEVFAPNYGVNLKRLTFQIDPYKAYRCSVPQMGTSLYYLVNDVFYASHMAVGSLPASVFVGSLRTYASSHPDFVRKYYGQLGQTGNDSLTAFNTAFAQDGLLIYVPDGVKVKQTLQVVNLMRGEIDLMTNRRNLIVVGDEAEVDVLFCEHALDNSNFLTTNVSEVFMGAHSRLSIYGVEETRKNNRFFENMYLSQGACSHLEYCTVTLQGGLTRRCCDFIFSGEGSDAHIMGAVIADGEQQVDNNLLVDHQKGKCKSNVLYKYVLNDHAVGAFAGKVMVRPGAQKTDSKETNANLCVSPTARMYTQPMLEIYADDVKCNHGSTVGQMDQSALFYMAQRGITPDEARLLMQHAFVNEVIEKIHLIPLRERLSTMVMQRFRHGVNACGDCNLCRTELEDVLNKN